MSLQQISDQLELQRLTYLYSAAIDRAAFDQLDQVFTPDAELDYLAAGGIKGAYPTVKAWLARALEMFGPSNHYVTNHLFQIDGDTATGRVMCFNPMGWPKATPNQDSRSIMFFTVWYHDRYVRTPAGWRIAARREEPWLACNLPESGMPDWSAERADPAA